MKKTVITSIVLASLLLTGCNSSEKKETTQESKLVQVTKENYPTVETSRQFVIQIQRAGGINKLDRWDGITKLDNQPIVRLNQDTVYSMGVVDASKGATITLPDAGDRFMSVQFVDEHHYVYAAKYGAGTFEIPNKTDYMYVNVRIASEQGTPEEDKLIAALQKKIVIHANSAKPFVPIKYDEASYKKTHKALLEAFNSGKYDPKTFFNIKGVVDEAGHQIGSAIGWGGGQRVDNIWSMKPNSSDFSCQSTTFEDPKLGGGFWSFTVYNKEGFLYAPANMNSYKAKPNADGTYTVRFGCDGKENNIKIKNDSGAWNAILRAYKPSKLVQSGKWEPLKHVVKESDTTPTVVTEDNYAQAYTNMRFAAIQHKAGGVNRLLEMPVPPSDPAKQFVVRMNRDTFYSVGIVDLSKGDVTVNIPNKSDRYVTMQVVNENHETWPMVYGTGKHTISAKKTKTKYAFVVVRALDDNARKDITIDSPSAVPFVAKKWDKESFKIIDARGNADFADGYDQSKAFNNIENGQTDHFRYVGAAGGWGGAMVRDNIYQTTPYQANDACYELTFPDPQDKYFWSVTVYNGDGRMFNDNANISSNTKPEKNRDGTYTLHFGCDGLKNNLPIVTGNTTGKWNLLMRHYGPSDKVRENKSGYNVTDMVKKIK